MSELEGQLSIFGMMDQYESPRLPYEACKAGVMAWVIECAAITNSWDTAAPVKYLTARPRKILFKRDSHEDPYGWCIYYDSVGGPGEYFGSWGARTDVFASRPTDADCERYAREHYGKDKRVSIATPFQMWV